MSDEYMGDVSPELEAGQPSDNVQADIQEGAKPKPVTLEDLTKLLDERDEQLKRTFQSLTDKQEDRVAKKLDKWKEALSKHGVNATDDMLNSKRLEIATQEANRAIAEDDDAPSHSRQTETQLDPVVVKQTNDAAEALTKEFGRVLNQGDPEYWDLKNAGAFDPARTGPEDFLRLYREKLVEVNTREGRPIPDQQPRTTGSPAARVPAPGGAPFGGVESITTELNALQNKVGKTPTDYQRINELTAELLKHVPKK